MLNTTSAHLLYSLTYPIAYNIVKSIIVAIDGTSSTGKSSIAKLLAQKIDYTYIDTGAMYRAVTLLALQNNVFHSDGSIDEPLLQELLKKARIVFAIIARQDIAICISMERMWKNKSVPWKYPPMSARLLPYHG